MRGDPDTTNLTETPMRPQTTACLACAAFLFTACTTTTAPAADALTQRLALHFGARAVGSDASSHTDTDGGGVVGIEYASRCWDWLGLEAGLSYSEHDEFVLFGVSESIEVVEVDAGARATYRGLADGGTGLLPYASLGLAALSMDGRGADRGAVGAFARGGLCYVFGCGFTLGADLKGLVSSSEDVDYYLQFTLQLGWSF